MKSILDDSQMNSKKPCFQIHGDECFCETQCKECAAISNKIELKPGQNLFNILKETFDVYALEGEMMEILRAVQKDNNLFK